MSDVLDMLRAGSQKADDRREQVRRDFPLCAEITEQLRAAFGPGVKPLYFSEAGKMMGKPQPFEGTDVDKLLRLVDGPASYARGKR